MHLSVNIESLLLFGSVLFLVSLFASKAGTRFGVPVLLLFIGVGMVFGTSGFGFDFENYNMSQAIGTVALCIILFSGGLDTSYKEIKPVAAQGIILATVGVVLTAFFTGVFIYFVLNFWFPWISVSFLEAMLLASVMSSTDSASVFAILRGKGVKIKNNLKHMLELESGSNDPMAYMLTVVLIQLITSEQHDELAYGTAVLSFFMQFVIGITAGFLLGKASVWLINKINLDNDSFYPILLITCGIFVFSATDFINGNGFLAVYLAGLVIGNSKFANKRLSLRVFDGLTWISQIILFLTLGLLVNPSELWPVAIVSLLIGAFMIFAARPLTVFISLFSFRKTHFRDKIFISWVGLKGAVPILFAIFPLTAHLAISSFVFNVVFFITLLSLLIQGTSLTQVAKLLHLSDENDFIKPKRFTIEFDEEIKSVLEEITIESDFSCVNKTISEMKLPKTALIVMIERKDTHFTPNGDTVIEADDRLSVIADSKAKLDLTFQALKVLNF